MSEKEFTTATPPSVIIEELKDLKQSNARMIKFLNALKEVNNQDYKKRFEDAYKEYNKRFEIDPRPT